MEELKMSISGIGQNDYQKYATKNRNVNRTKKFALKETNNPTEVSEAEEMEIFKKKFYDEIDKIPRNF